MPRRWTLGARRSQSPSRIGGTVVPTQVQVSFQFTCRTGVGVQVVGADDHVDLLISLNSVDYHAPPLPPRQTDTWTKDRLNAIDGGAADLLSFEQIASLFEGSPVSKVVAEYALAHGIETDKYDVPDVNVLDRAHAVPFVATNQIPAGQGIVVNDNQPYPVVGFVSSLRGYTGAWISKLSWLRSPDLNLPTTTSRSLTRPPEPG